MAQVSKEAEDLSLGMRIASFIFPPLGIFLYFSEKKKNSFRAEDQALSYAAFGSVTLFLLYIAFAVTEGGTSLMLMVIAAFIILMGSTIFMLRTILDRGGKQVLENVQPGEGGPLTKKYYQADVKKYSGLVFNLGLIASLAVCLAAFEYKSYDKTEIVVMGAGETQFEEQEEVPITEQLPPPPPKIMLPEIVEVPDEKVIEQKIEVDLNVEVDQNTVVTQQQVVVEEEKEEEVVEEIFTIVEETAQPVGGMEAFYKYLKKSLKYPNQAKRMGVEGKVFVQFVVEKDGTLTDIKVLKGIGAGCDEEAVRVLQEAQKWSPGKQRGRNVRQRMSVPINFKLG